MSTHLDKTQGIGFVGMVVAAVLYGISCVQALYYYTSQNDPWYTKFIVTAIMIFNTVHQALVTHTVYTYTITDWGDPAQLKVPVWSLLAEIIFTGVTAFIVQSFLTMRIWRLRRRNIYITSIFVVIVIVALGLLITSVFVILIVSIVQLSQFKTWDKIIKIKALYISINALHALADILIAATLCTLLNISRTGFHRTEVIINRLIVFTVNTGVLTSFCALGSLISSLVARDTYLNIAFFFCLGRLYTNTLLATLNARKRIQDVSNIESVSLRNLSKSGTNQHQDISINIKTITQEHYDPKADEESSELPHDEESTTSKNKKNIFTEAIRAEITRNSSSYYSSSNDIL